MSSQEHNDSTLEDMNPNIKFELDRFCSSLKRSPYAEASLKKNFLKKIRRFKLNQLNKEERALGVPNALQHASEQTQQAIAKAEGRE